MQNALALEPAWTFAVADHGAPGGLQSTPIVAYGCVYIAAGTSQGGLRGDGARVPWHFLDARTGRTLATTYAITEDEAARGYGGSGIWATAAVDPGTGHLYAGTSDSDGHHRQHRFDNAVLKIDADPRRSSFGAVVDAYSGTSEHHDLNKLGYDGNPVCDAGDGSVLPSPDGSQSTECLELDLDFGASPNLYLDVDGSPVLAAMQKSGVVHVV